MNLRTQRWAARTLGPLTGAVSQHWYREHDDEPDVCALRECGRPRFTHWQEVGEWMLPARERWRRIAERARTRWRASR